MKINKLTIFSIALSTLLFSCNEDEQISNLQMTTQMVSWSVEKVLQQEQDP